MSSTPLLTGIDHIYLSVTDFRESERFYDKVMGALGLKKGTRAIAGENHAHYYAPSIQLTIRPARSTEPHSAYSPGLHHLCFQCVTREDVDVCYGKLAELGVTASKPRLYPEYSPDYYATFFTDPDGIRLEIVNQTAERRQIEEGPDPPPVE